ncbi:TIGR00341 family protein [Hyphomonas sp.]|uniref:TIGR00341 family protein n=1 Tax=Hyphomonas sp. TaxID=87 RepID=UPI003F70BFBB|tara:strand:- start:6273 stop:7901 length:1629 start_codon:yes stop_codon:yes gene_type:complete
MKDQTARTGTSRYNWRRYLALGLKQLSRRIDHKEVVQHVREEGALSGRYIFMIITSCAIATLGLLLSSPAVIIGAMLISPLMGPIMQMGFSLPILELASLRRSVVTLFWGTVVAVAVAFLIVHLSPLKAATPEILARIRPNFLDLLVAIFSGLAGGYAVIHRKGETIVGVAIATALMPPLAVTGYGLAVGSLTAAGGAFLLFMTNLLAIALTVTVLARIYGFGSEHSPRHTLWQSGLIFLVFAALSVPLGFALRDIAFETNVRNTVRASLLDPFDGTQARLSDIAFTFGSGRDVGVSATVLTRKLNPQADAVLTASVSERIGRPVVISLDQVLIDDDGSSQAAEILQIAESTLAAPLRAELSALKATNRLRQTETDLRRSVPLTLTAADINAETRQALFLAAPDDAYGLSAYRRMEASLAGTFPDWEVRIMPPVAGLPAIPFETGLDTLSDAAAEQVDTAAWALERWNVGKVEVIGYSPTAAATLRIDPDALYVRRSETVARRLRDGGLEAISATEYRANAAGDVSAGAPAGTDMVSIRPGR